MLYHLYSHNFRKLYIFIDSYELLKYLNNIIAFISSKPIIVNLYYPSQNYSLEFRFRVLDTSKYSKNHFINDS